MPDICINESNEFAQRKLKLAVLFMIRASNRLTATYQPVADRAALIARLVLRFGMTIQGAGDLIDEMVNSGELTIK